MLGVWRMNSQQQHNSNHILNMRKFCIPASLLPGLAAAKAATAGTTTTITTVASATAVTSTGRARDTIIEIDGDGDGPASKKIRSSSQPEPQSQSQPQSAAVTSAPATRTLHRHLSMLSPQQREHAKTCPANRWVSFPGALVYLRTEPFSETASRMTGAKKGVVAFDMDGTIIATKSGKRFPVDGNDWKFWDSSVPVKLRALHEDGYLLAFISNQGGISQKKQSDTELKTKVETIINNIGVPIDFICSTESIDVLRKPRTGMWDFLAEARWDNYLTHSLLDPTREISQMYVGDAAGRPAQGTKSKDHSDTDLKLAVNLGVDFQTPEKFFLNSTQKLHNDFATTLVGSIRLADLPNHPFDEQLLQNPAAGPEIVLLAAAPASGKSTIANKMIGYGYVRINQDQLGNIKACLSAAKSALREGKSVVVDNTNLNPQARQSWIEVAKEFGVKIRAIIVQTPKDVCMTLSTLRLIDPRTPAHDRRKIETVVFHKFFKDPSFPSEKEGFHRVDTVSWSPMLPSIEKDPVSHQLYFMYLK